MTHRKHLNAHGFPVHAPKAEKPTGANGYCGNEGGIVWCSILKERETFVKDDLSAGNHSTAIREFRSSPLGQKARSGVRRHAGHVSSCPRLHTRNTADVR